MIRYACNLITVEALILAALAAPLPDPHHPNPLAVVDNPVVVKTPPLKAEDDDDDEREVKPRRNQDEGDDE